VLVSFDIDGTLETGSPRGPVLLEHVREAQRRGHVIGSASDRTLSDQRRLWRAAGIDVDFVTLKHGLLAVVAGFGCEGLIHIGDTQADEYYAGLAGLAFWHVDRLPDPGSEGWVY
jgi:hydroxymethylpyrimidine pyrophosphatase-like HAD family hydrolase